MNDRLGQSRSPDFVEVLRTAMDLASNDLFVARPGMVVKYDSNSQKADIKPLIKKPYIKKDGTKDVDSLPVLTDVPIIFPRAGGFYITLPLQPGDDVGLIFMDNSIDLYMNSFGTVDIDPIDLRSHDLSDAIAIPGMYPFLRSLSGISNTDLEIGHEVSKFKILITPTGEVEINLAELPVLKIELAGPNAKLTLGDGAQSVALGDTLETFWNTFVSGIVSGWGSNVPGVGHTHSGVQPGTGSTGPPVASIASFPTAAKSTKMKVPS